jgi:hypothetical protein
MAHWKFSKGGGEDKNRGDDRNYVFCYILQVEFKSDLCTPQVELTRTWHGRIPGNVCCC